MGVITDAQARKIASDWHGGQWSALYSLASAGYVDRDRVRAEIAAAVQALDVGEVRRDLLALDKYVTQRADTGPVPGWHELWDPTPASLDQT